MDFLSPKVGTGSLEITEKRRSELSLDFSMRESRGVSPRRGGGDRRKAPEFPDLTPENLPDFLTVA